MTLDPMIHIQTRPSMYLGGAETQRETALREVIDNSTDEIRAGHGTFVQVIFHPDGSAEVHDDGRGIPTGINSKTGENGIYMSVGKPNSGGKFGSADSGYAGNASAGLNGVGTSATNACSKRFDVTVYQGGKEHRLSFKDGKPGHFAIDNDPDSVFTPSMDIVSRKDPRTAAEKKARPTGTSIRLWINDFILPIKGFRISHLRDRLKGAAFLVPQLKYIIDDFSVPGEESTEIYQFDDGILGLIESAAPDQKLHEPFLIETEGSFEEHVPVPQKDGTVQIQAVQRPVKIQTAFRWGNGYDTVVKSYVNTISTPLGGTHVDGMQRAMRKVIIDEIKNTRGAVKGKDEPPILDDVMEGLTVVLSIEQPEPQFVGQDKQKLGSDQTATIVNRALSSALKEWWTHKKNASVVKIIIAKILEASRVRQQEKAQKDTARKASNLETSSLMPSKLVACAVNEPEFTELQICEGDSALGGLKLSRDASYQAIYPLKGKPKNSFDQPLSAVLDNVEMSDLIKIIGAGVGKNFDITKMRYKRIIMLADADADGSHIRVLLIGFFWKFMRPLIEEGRLFTAMPPLFSVTTTGKNKEKYFALNQEELELVTKKLDSQKKNYGKPTRHKGLGEYATEVLVSEVMSPETRTLRQITVKEVEDARDMLELTLGGKTAGAAAAAAARREWIMAERSLVSNDEIDA